MVQKLSKTVSAKKSIAAIVAVYVYAFESSPFVLLENGVCYYTIIYSLEDISV